MPRVRLQARLVLSCLFALMLAVLPAQAQDITPFVGTFEGSAVLEGDSGDKRRDMSVVIDETKAGFSVSWASVTYEADGKSKQKSYTIEFLPSQRENIFASAMKSNVFGKQVPLDPLRGEPFVWARLMDQTLTVFSLFINETGDYEMQEYHRTLADGGLKLEFRRLRNGSEVRSLETFLKRQ